MSSVKAPTSNIPKTYTDQSVQTDPHTVNPANAYFSSDLQRETLNSTPNCVNTPASPSSLDMNQLSLRAISIPTAAKPSLYNSRLDLRPPPTDTPVLRVVSLPALLRQPTDSPLIQDIQHRSFDIYGDTSDTSLDSERDSPALESYLQQRGDKNDSPTRYRSPQTPSPPTSPESVIILTHSGSESQLSASFLRGGGKEGMFYATHNKIV
jgi:hypothetical protein